MSPMPTTFRSAGKLEHTLTFDGCVVITTAFFIVRVIEAFTEPQGPAGSSVVYVNVTVPALISAALGVYTAVGVLLLNVPLPLVVHVADVAPPPNEPAIVAVPSEQMGRLGPALTVGAGFIVIVI